MFGRLCFLGIIMAVVLTTVQDSSVFAQVEGLSDTNQQIWTIYGPDGDRALMLYQANEQMPELTPYTGMFDGQGQEHSQGVETSAPDAPQVDCSTISTLTAPRLVAPANGINLTTLIPSLQVEVDEEMYASDSGLWLYVRVSTTPDFSEIVWPASVGYLIKRGFYTPRITYQVRENLDPARTYYWQAYLMCHASGGTQGPYSSAQQFRAGSGGIVPSSAPQMMTPAPNAFVSLPAVLQWTAVNGATGYRVYITQDAITYPISIAITRYSLEGSWVTPNQQYTWKVRAYNDYAYGVWTDQRTFRYGPYQPDPYGYSFENSRARASWSIFRDTFGRSNVEYDSGRRIPIAEEYYNQTFNETGDGGVCGGMAASSALLFRGWAIPTEYLAGRGAVNASDLIAPTISGGAWTYGQVADFIVRYQGYQAGKEISNAKRNYNLTYSQAIQRIVDSIDGGLAHPVYVGVRGLSRSSCAGHALIPFGYIQSGNQLIVSVYDPNHQTASGQRLVFNLSNPSAISWEYNHNNSIGIWTSSSQCANLKVLPISLWQNNPTPPWNIGGQRSSDLNQADGYYDLSVTGSAYLLIIDDQGRMLGYRDGQLVEEIPGSVFVVLGGAIPDVPVDLVERYHVDADANFQVRINYTDAGEASVDYFAPDAIVQVTGSSGSADVADTLSISPSGNEVRLTAGATADNRSVKLLQQAETWANEATVLGFNLAANDTAVIRLDPIETVNPTFVFRSNTDDQDYGFGLRYSTADGTNVGYYSGGITFGQGDTHRLTMNWENPETGLLEIDYGSDGTIDETVVLPNQIKSVFLPMVLGSQ